MPNDKKKTNTKAPSTADVLQDIMGLDGVRALQVCYVRFNPTCAYAHMKKEKCSGDVTVIRVSNGTDGSVAVSTLCDVHARGEQAHALVSGMQPAGPTAQDGLFTTAVFVDPIALEAMKPLFSPAALTIIEESP